MSFFEERRKTQNQNKRNDDRLLIVEVAAATDPVARDACLVRMDDDEGGAPKKRAKTQSVCPTPGELIKQRIEYRGCGGVVQQQYKDEPGWYICQLDNGTTKVLLFESCHQNEVWRIVKPSQWHMLPDDAFASIASFASVGSVANFALSVPMTRAQREKARAATLATHLPALAKSGRLMRPLNDEDGNPVQPSAMLRNIVLSLFGHAQRLLSGKLLGRARGGGGSSGVGGSSGAGGGGGEDEDDDDDEEEEEEEDEEDELDEADEGASVPHTEEDDDSSSSDAEMVDDADELEQDEDDEIDEDDESDEDYGSKSKGKGRARRASSRSMTVAKSEKKVEAKSNVPTFIRSCSAGDGATWLREKYGGNYDGRLHETAGEVPRALTYVVHPNDMVATVFEELGVSNGAGHADASAYADGVLRLVKNAARKDAKIAKRNDGACALLDSAAWLHLTKVVGPDRAWKCVEGIAGFGEQLASDPNLAHMSRVLRANHRPGAFGAGSCEALSYLASFRRALLVADFISCFRAFQTPGSKFEHWQPGNFSRLIFRAAVLSGTLSERAREVLLQLIGASSASLAPPPPRCPPRPTTHSQAPDYSLLFRQPPHAAAQY